MSDFASIVPGAFPVIWSLDDPPPPAVYEVWEAPDPDYLYYEDGAAALNHLLVTEFWDSEEFERRVLPHMRQFGHIV